MHWKLRAKIAHTISLLPSRTSDAVYYCVQRRLGRFRLFNPLRWLETGVETGKRIRKLGQTASDKVFFEIGTGRVPLLSLAYWLMGAERTISLDVYPYLREELIRESLGYICKNQEEIVSLFGTLLHKERFNDLLEFARSSRYKLSEFLHLCRMDYIAPGNAADTRLPDQSVDFHTSRLVFEHIPPVALTPILMEGNRIIKDNGLFIHWIDYCDHFSRSDTRLSCLNFLQYRDDEWEKYVGNSFMYVNRLRHDDFINLFCSVGHRICDVEANVDQGLLPLLKGGHLHLNERFRSKASEVLATTSAWVITQKSD